MMKRCVKVLSLIYLLYRSVFIFGGRGRIRTGDFLFPKLNFAVSVQSVRIKNYRRLAAWLPFHINKFGSGGRTRTDNHRGMNPGIYL